MPDQGVVCALGDHLHAAAGILDPIITLDCAGGALSVSVEVEAATDREAASTVRRALGTAPPAIASDATWTIDVLGGPVDVIG